MASKERQQKKQRYNPCSNHLRRSGHEDTLPGVQKLKSSLRQAKRLLSKDSLAADVRVETERRLKALEADLARAEQSRKERQHATRYHKIKFFERQKVVRKINQTKRRLATTDGKEKEKLQSVLADLRVDLNYVLHFPKTKKYISLFPPEVRGSSSIAELVTASPDDNADRSTAREIICQQMKCGELSTEPENELGKPGQESGQSVLVPSRRGTDPVSSSGAQTHINDVASDNFFGDDDEEDDGFQQSEASDS